MVLISAAIFLTAIFYMTGLGVGTRHSEYKMYLNYAGGLEPGATVRFGGLKVGRVKKLQVDPQNQTRIEIHLQVQDGTPIRTDSVASISQLGMLGENYIEITPGKAATKLQAGAVIPSAETQDIA
ncbi:MAG: MlaD family protein, partial [Gammaproteobacteria bacterium]